MKKFLIIICLFFVTSLFAEPIVSLFPPETFSLKLPSHVSPKWKEITREISKSDALVELIPADQSEQNFSEFVVIQFIDTSAWNSDLAISLDQFLDFIYSKTNELKPQQNMTCKKLEKRGNDIVYESLIKENGKIVENEICRSFLTKKGYHHIGYVHKGEMISEEEKLKWMNIFRDCASVVSFQDAVKLKDELSIVYKR